MEGGMFETVDVIEQSFSRSEALAVQRGKSRIALYENAYEGVYRVYLPLKIQAELAGRLGIRTNLCAAVVDAMVAKLDLKSYAGGTDADQAILTEEYEYNQLELQSTEIHRMTGIDGDGFMVVWPEYNELGKKTGHAFVRVLASQDIDMTYSPADKLKPIRCVHQWIEEELGKMYVGKPVVRRDTMTAKNIHREYSVSGEGDKWIDWTFDGLEGIVTNDLGVIPVVHFRNKIGLSAFGTSELENALPIQNDINRLVQDAMIRSYFNGGQQLAVFGIDADEFIKKNPDGLSREVWGAWMFDNEKASLTMIQPQDMADMWNSVDKRIDHLCRATATPVSYLDPKAAPSGVAMQEMSGPLIDKVYEAQTTLGSAWARVFSLILKVRTNNLTPVHVEWEEPFVQSNIDTDLKLYAAGAISQAELLRRQGMNQTQIDSIIAERQAEQQAAATSIFKLPNIVPPI
jgi:hypothetical protein